MRKLVWILVLCLVLSGCSRMPYDSEDEPEIILPEPSEAPANMFLGEHTATKAKDVTLYYVANDGASFSSVTRSMLLSPDESLLEEAVRSLLSATPSADRMSIVPAETQLLNIEYACGIATVNLSLDAHGFQSDQEYLMLMASITNTLLTITGVRGVNILIADRSAGIASLPSGAKTFAFTAITPAYAQLNAENDYFVNSKTGTIDRTAVLYFPVDTGNWLVPELREITFSDTQYVNALLDALHRGPAENLSAKTVMPESAELLLEPPRIEVTTAGERVMRLNFSPTLRNYLAFSGFAEWELYGSIVLTLCSFIPELDGVRVLIDDVPLEGLTISGVQYAYPEGLLHRSDFTRYIGSTIQLYFPQENGALRPIERAVSMRSAESPRSRLFALIDGTLSDPSVAQFPADIYYDDVLGIYVENGIASVNLSANFYRTCSNLNAEGESAIIYAIVNTLCELDDILGVRFYIEGISAETLSGNIYLKDILLPNPGLADSVTSTAVPDVTETP